MKKAAIYNLTWDSLGGGERYAASFGKLVEAQGEYDLEIWWDSDIRREIHKRFNIELSKSRFVPNPLVGKNVFEKMDITSKYDVIFWVSDGSIPVSRAKKTLMHFQIPFHSRECKTWFNQLKAKMYSSICNSQYTKKIIDETYGINSEVIYPPVDTSLFNPGKKENLIVSIGRLSRELHAKRQEVLIEAFSAVSKQLGNWKLVIAGGSQDIEYYKDLISLARGLPVKIIANPSLVQIQDLLAKAKIFWSATGFEVDTLLDPEKAEHFGITPVEAMSAGAVPIITAAGGHLETVQQGKDGFLWNTLDELSAYTVEMATNYRKWGIFSKKSQQRSKIFDRAVFEEKFVKYL